MPVSIWQQMDSEPPLLSEALRDLQIIIGGNYRSKDSQSSLVLPPVQKAAFLCLRFWAYRCSFAVLPGETSCIVFLCRCHSRWLCTVQGQEAHSTVLPRAAKPG